jgi:hypothetical protein
MKNLYKKGVALLLSVMCIASLLTNSAYAATGKEGYAIHRDGAFLGLTWHAGFMDQSSSTDPVPVIHIGSLFGTVTWAGWATFIDGNTFKGYYKPSGGITSTGRDLVKETVRELALNNVTYTAVSQIDYDVALYVTQTYVYPEDVMLSRCDGVVEYGFEWNNYRIYGNNTYWDISRANLFYWDHHSGTMVTPKSQAESYMTEVI